MYKISFSILLFLYISRSFAQSIEFDENVLRRLGVNPQLTTFFADKPKFNPGLQRVHIQINGTEPLNDYLLIQENGEPCFDAVFLEKFKLKKQVSDSECVNFAIDYPESSIKLLPNENKVALILPERAFAHQKNLLYSYHGKAMLINYSLFSQGIKNRNNHDRYYSGTLNPGFNYNNWVLRGQYYFNHNKEHRSLNRQALYIQKAIEDWNGMWQAGEINLNNSHYAGLSFNGMQFYSDYQINQSERLIIPIEGVLTNSAIIEIRQYGKLVYQSAFPAGPYQINYISGLISNSDLDVSIIENGSIVQSFLFPNRSLSLKTLPKYAFSIGKYRNTYSKGPQTKYQPWFISAEYDLKIINDIPVSVGGLISEKYQSVSGKYKYPLSKKMSVNVDLQLINNQQNIKGMIGLSGYRQLFSSLSLNVFSSFYNRGYTNPNEALRGYDIRNNEGLKYLYGGSITLSFPTAGVFSFSGFNNFYYDRSNNYSSSLHYSKRINKVNINGSIQYNSQSSQRSIYSLSLNIPFDSWSYSSNHVKRGEYLSHQLNINHQLFNDVSYSLNLSKSGKQESLNASLNAKTAYTSLYASVNKYQGNHGGLSYFTHLKGGMVIIPDAFAFSPNAITDTFAIMKYGDVSSLRLRGSSGSVKTQFNGLAVISSIQPYQQNYMEVDGNTLPKDVYLESVRSTFSLAYGSVAYKTLSSKRIKQLILQIKLDNDASIQLGTLVHNDNKEIIGLTLRNNLLLIADDQIGQNLFLSYNNQICKIKYNHMIDTSILLNPIVIAKLECPQK